MCGASKSAREAWKALEGLTLGLVRGDLCQGQSGEELPCCTKKCLWKTGDTVMVVTVGKEDEVTRGERKPQVGPKGPYRA